MQTLQPEPEPANNSGRQETHPEFFDHKALQSLCSTLTQHFPRWFQLAYEILYYSNTRKASPPHPNIWLLP